MRALALLQLAKRIALFYALVVFFHLGSIGSGYTAELGSNGKCYAVVWHQLYVMDNTFSVYSPNAIIGIDLTTLKLPSSEILYAKDLPNADPRFPYPYEAWGLQRYEPVVHNGTWRITGQLYGPLRAWKWKTDEVNAGLTSRFGPPLTWPKNFTPGTTPPGCEPSECTDPQCLEQQLGDPDLCNT